VGVNKDEERKGEGKEEKNRVEKEGWIEEYVWGKGGEEMTRGKWKGEIGMG